MLPLGGQCQNRIGPKDLQVFTEDGVLLAVGEILLSLTVTDMTLEELEPGTLK